ncbi:ASCH domain-containing protein [Undibacterium crateris]|uniref:hypothetical protein n=1 Tax=Undibacterium crateris TaxID=2528175 RepID=UPI001389E3ED|nr:hypothetical protein [Undibacterium crateris]NDI85098.1 hypothetical protein [Undibacterium crateris]
MNENPIAFIGEMVSAILDGRKTQTRRILKVQPTVTESRLRELGAWNPDLTLSQHVNQAWQAGFICVKCPLGEVGDQLWVQEDFALSVIDPDGGSPEDEPENYDVIYRDGDVPLGGWTDGAGNAIPAPWQGASNMPRWASRIRLEITDIRIERLNDISEADAIAEGLELTLRGWKSTKYQHVFYTPPIMAFQDLWGFTGGDWDANPWVWVISFKCVQS